MAYNELWTKHADSTEAFRIPIVGADGKRRSIAAFVASTGSTLRLDDAYKCEHFDPEHDRKSGFRTRSVLAVALREEDRRSDSGPFGVLMLINKHSHGGHFSDHDEELAIGTFCGHAGSGGCHCVPN